MAARGHIQADDESGRVARLIGYTLNEGETAEALIARDMELLREAGVDSPLSAIEELTNRRVTAFLSANQTTPGVACELFFLDASPLEPTWEATA